MKMNTRIFGEIEIEDEKVIKFENGIIGFPDLKEFALIHDEEQGNGAGIRWMQSLQEPNFAMPVIDPLNILTQYNPEIEDDHLKIIGDFTEEDLLVLTTITIPSDLTKMTVNLKAPFVINAATRKACQIVTDNEQYPIKFPVYDLLMQAKKAGE